MTFTDPYVIDACALINLEKIRPLWDFPPPGSGIIVTERIAEEVKGGFFIYKNWLQSGNLEKLKGEEELTFLKLLSPKQQPRIHDGEASIIAIGIHRGWPIVSDERATKKKATIHGVRCLNCQEFMGLSYKALM